MYAGVCVLPQHPASASSCAVCLLQTGRHAAGSSGAAGGLLWAVPTVTGNRGCSSARGAVMASAGQLRLHSAVIDRHAACIGPVLRPGGEAEQQTLDRGPPVSPVVCHDRASQQAVYGYIGSVYQRGCIMLSGSLGHQLRANRVSVARARHVGRPTRSVHVDKQDCHLFQHLQQLGEGQLGPSCVPPPASGPCSGALAAAASGDRCRLAAGTDGPGWCATCPADQGLPIDDSSGDGPMRDIGFDFPRPVALPRRSTAGTEVPYCPALVVFSGGTAFNSVAGGHPWWCILAGMALRPLCACTWVHRAPRSCSQRRAQLAAHCSSSPQ